MGHPLSMAALTTRAVVGATRRGSGEETKFVRPEVIRLLEKLEIKHVRELVFDLLDDDGNVVLSGSFDIVFRDPRSQVGALIIVETKGIDLNALTPNQRIYVLRMESAQGAWIRSRSRIAGDITLLYGETIRVTGDNYLRVGKSNLEEFSRHLTEIKAQGKFVAAAYDPVHGRVYFRTHEEADAYYRKMGMDLSPDAPRWRTAGKVLGKGALVLGIVGELLAPLDAAAQIDELSGVVGDAVSTNVRKLIQIDHPSWIPLRDGRFYLDPRSGTLYQVLTDLQTLTEYAQARPIAVLSPYQIRPGAGIPRDARLDTSNWWSSMETGTVVYQDADGTWKLERYKDPGVLDDLAESFRRIPYALTE